jgi:hypothetical protein
MDNSTATCTRATILEAAKKLDRIQKQAAHHMACFGTVMTRIIIDEYLSPPILKWWETVLTWNPCNTFVNQESVVYMLPNMCIISPRDYSILKAEFNE